MSFKATLAGVVGIGLGGKLSKMKKRQLNRGTAEKGRTGLSSVS